MGPCQIGPHADHLRALSGENECSAHLRDPPLQKSAPRYIGTVCMATPKPDTCRDARHLCACSDCLARGIG
jgi:hypothetical protein